MIVNFYYIKINHVTNILVALFFNLIVLMQQYPHLYFNSLDHYHRVLVLFFFQHLLWLDYLRLHLMVYISIHLELQYYCIIVSFVQYKIPYRDHQLYILNICYESTIYLVFYHFQLKSLPLFTLYYFIFLGYGINILVY